MLKKIVIAAASLLLASAIHAEDNFPTKPIRFVVAYGAGGSTDQIARALGQVVARRLGQSVVIENKPGGSGLIAAAQVAQAAPDGYTLGVTAVGILRAPHIQKTAVDPIADLTWVSMINEFGLLVGVKNDAPWKSMKELVDYAKKNPQKVSFASPGMLSTQQLALSQLGAVTGAQWAHAPFKGDAEAITSTIGGHTQFVGASDTILPFVKNGSLRVLATLNENRLSAYPDTPTLKELGYPVIGASSLGLIAPKGLKPDVLKKLERVFEASVKDPEFLNAIKVMGVDTRYMNSEQYTRYAKEVFEASRELVTKYGKE